MCYVKKRNEIHYTKIIQKMLDKFLLIMAFYAVCYENTRVVGSENGRFFLG